MQISQPAIFASVEVGNVKGRQKEVFQRERSSKLETERGKTLDESNASFFLKSGTVAGIGWSLNGDRGQVERAVMSLLMLMVMLCL